MRSRGADRQRVYSQGGTRYVCSRRFWFITVVVRFFRAFFALCAVSYLSDGFDGNSVILIGESGILENSDSRLKFANSKSTNAEPNTALGFFFYLGMKKKELMIFFYFLLDK